MRFQSFGEAGEYVADLARGIEARAIVRSTHEAVDRLGVEALLSDTGVDVSLMAADGVDLVDAEERRRLKYFCEMTPAGQFQGCRQASGAATDDSHSHNLVVLCGANAASSDIGPGDF